MNTALTLVIVLLVLLLMLLGVALLMYYVTQQDLRNLSSRLGALDTPKSPPPRSPDLVRRERSAAFDRLVLIEASLSTEPREALNVEEQETFEEARRVIKNCNAELQRLQDWMGLPFDLEWTEFMARLPRLMPLYRKAVDESLKEDGQSAG
jgi:hypothetical protein